MNDRFRRFAEGSAEVLGASWSFTLAAVIVALWLAAGPIFRWSNTWQLVMNTVTSVLAFLMVFLLQNTQNRDTRAILLKLDELLRATGEARSSLVQLETLSDDELARLEEEFRRLREQAVQGRRTAGNG